MKHLHLALVIFFLPLCSAFARGDCRAQLENYGGPGSKQLTQACSQRAIKKALRDRRFAHHDGKLVVVGKNFLLVKPQKDLSAAIKAYNHPEKALDEELKRKRKLEAATDVNVIAGKTAVPWSEEVSVVVKRFRGKDFAFIMDGKENFLYSVDLSKFGNIVPTTKAQIAKSVVDGRVRLLTDESLVIVGGKSPKHQVVKLVAKANLPELKPIDPQDWKLSFRQAGPMACADSNCFAMNFSNSALVKIEVDAEGKVKPGHEIPLRGVRDPVYLQATGEILSVFEGDGKVTRVSH